jgi:hypothetical protein
MGINDIIEYIGQGDWTSSADGGFVIVYQPGTTDPSGKILTQSRGYAFPASGLGGEGGGVGTLQEVTDEGNTTNTNIEFDAGVGVVLDNGSILREGTTDAGTGGNNGIAQICAVGYELKWEAGSQYVMDGNGLLIREVNHKFNIDPTPTNDETEGFYVGSRWVLDNGTTYVCNDATEDNADWVDISLSLQTAYDQGNTINGFNIVFDDVDANIILSNEMPLSGQAGTFVGLFAGNDSQGDNNVCIGSGAGSENEGNDLIAISAAGNGNTGDNVVAIGNGAGNLNQLSNSFIIGNNQLPTFATHIAAALAITIANGASEGSTYLYHNQATDSIGAVRIA